MLACVLFGGFSDAFGMIGGPQGGSQDIPLIQVAEFLRLGEATNGETPVFGFISAIAVDGAGRIFVGERQDPKVYVFSEDGKYVTAVGSRGVAPGEFRDISSIYAGPADSLFIYDNFFSERLTVYEPKQYQIAYTVGIQKSGSDFAQELLGVTSESLVFRYHRSTELATENERRFSTVRLVDWNGEIISGPLLTIEQAELFVTANRNFTRAENLPFGRASTIRMSPDRRLYWGWNDAVDIKISGLNGTVLRQNIYPQQPLRVSNADRRTALQRGSDEMRKRLTTSELHDTWPVYESFVVDERGAVWLELVEKEDDGSTSWLVLHASGQATGMATLPATFDLRVVKSGRLYGTDRNESGAPIVVGYEFVNY